MNSTKTLLSLLFLVGTSASCNLFVDGELARGMSDAANNGGPEDVQDIAIDPDAPDDQRVTDGDQVVDIADLSVDQEIGGDRGPPSDLGADPRDSSDANDVSDGGQVCDLADFRDTEDCDTGPFIVVPLLEPMEPGDTATIEVDTSEADGFTIVSYAWVQKSGVPVAVISGQDTASLTIALAEADEYRNSLVELLQMPDRAGVVGVEPQSLAAVQQLDLEVTAWDDIGDTLVASVEIQVELGLRATTGLRNVAVGVPVILQGPSTDAGSYLWILVEPDDSVAPLGEEARSRWPVFVPDVGGIWTATESVSGTSVQLRVAQWAGAIDGVGEDGVPEAGGCRGCHAARLGKWQQSGHATIFTRILDDPGASWNPECAPCHTVGYDPASDNLGFDEAAATETWEAPSVGASGTFAEMLESSPGTASLANVQCENCHGPVGPGGDESHIDFSMLNDQGMGMRSYGAAACASCHGVEPYTETQEWRASAHGNPRYSATQGRADQPSCSRCHTAQGFVIWLEQIQNGGDPSEGIAEEDIWWDHTDGEPVTCVACHDPHETSDDREGALGASVRLSGSTPQLIAGFEVADLGRGAVCVMCHNSRRGPHDDSIGEAIMAAPHFGAQGDVISGENAFFVEVGERSSHANVSDSCVGCHRFAITAPESGFGDAESANHTFSARLDGCSSCHGDTYDGTSHRTDFEFALSRLRERLSNHFVNTANATNELVLPEYEPDEDILISLTGNPIASADLLELHGYMFVSFVLADSSEYSVPLDEVYTHAGGGEPGTPLFGTDSLLARGLWNLLLLEIDDSGGIHNPAWASDVITATLAAVPE